MSTTTTNAENPRPCATEAAAGTVDGMSKSDAIWTIEDVAAFYRRSVRQARRIVAAPDFPAPVRGDNHRWLADHVRAWAAGSWQPESVATPATVLRPHTASSNRVVRRKAA
jgi:hypothetical protein